MLWSQGYSYSAQQPGDIMWKYTLYPINSKPNVTNISEGRFHIIRFSLIHISTNIHGQKEESLYGYSNDSPFLSQIFFFFLVTWCSPNFSSQCFFLNILIQRGSQSSLAIPRSLQHRIKALDLQPSVAVGIPLGSK